MITYSMIQIISLLATSLFLFIVVSVSTVMWMEDGQAPAWARLGYWLSILSAVALLVVSSVAASYSIYFLILKIITAILGV